MSHSRMPGCRRCSIPENATAAAGAAAVGDTRLPVATREGWDRECRAQGVAMGRLCFMGMAITVKMPSTKATTSVYMPTLKFPVRS